MTLSKLLLGLTLAFGLTGCQLERGPSIRTGQNQAWQTYQNPKYGFSFPYPDRWVASLTTEKEDGSTFADPENPAVEIRGWASSSPLEVSLANVKSPQPKGANPKVVSAKVAQPKSSPTKSAPKSSPTGSPAQPTPTPTETNFQTLQGIPGRLQVKITPESSSLNLTLMQGKTRYYWRASAPSDRFADYYPFFYYVVLRYQILPRSGSLKEPGSDEVIMNLRPPLFVGICLTATVTLAATVYAVTKPRLAEPASQQSRQAVSTVSSPCQAQVNDPHPPLNVRSTPDDASNNVVGTVANGSAVTIVNSHRKWVQISAPISGWVYEDYVSSNCQHAAAAADLEAGEQIYTLAMGLYQVGQLDTAIKQLKTISMQSPTYRKAQIALKTLPAEWQQAERQYKNAALAYKAGKWNDVVVTVNNFPDIRFWREKLTPLVKQAIANQQKATTTAQSQAS